MPHTNDYRDSQANPTFTDSNTNRVTHHMAILPLVFHGGENLNFRLSAPSSSTVGKGGEVHHDRLGSSTSVADKLNIAISRAQQLP